jgi:hypothetical protein
MADIADVATENQPWTSWKMATNSHSVLRFLFDLDVAQDSNNIGIIVHGALDLVQELSFARINGNHAIAVFLHGHVKLSVRSHLDNGKSKVGGIIWEALEAGEVAASNIGRAFDEMARNEGMGELWEIASFPAKVICCATDGRRGISDAAAQDDISAMLQSLHDAPSAQVALGIDWLKVPLAQRPT